MSNNRKSYQEVADIHALCKKKFQTGVWYEHYKGTKYFVIDVATSFVDDVLQTQVVYYPEGHKDALFVRDIETFTSEVLIDGVSCLRYKKID